MIERVSGRTLTWRSANGCLVRVAAPGESAEYERLIRLVRTSFDEQRAEIEMGMAGSLIEQADGRTGRKSLQDQLARALNGELDLLTFLKNVAVPFVALDSDARVVAALHAIAPGRVIGELVTQQWPRSASLSLATRAVKIAALWVDVERRRAGLGTALLHSCCDAYFSAGYRLVYGNYRAREKITSESFYRAAGFQLLPHGETVLLGLDNGAHVLSLGTDEDQGMFYMTAADWRRRASPDQRMSD